MAEHRERLLKLTQDKKNNKRLVKPNQPTRLSFIVEQVREGSSGSLGSRDVTHCAAVWGKKRSLPEGE